MAKRKLSISNLNNVPANIAKEAAKAMEGVKQNNIITEKQNNIKTETKPKAKSKVKAEAKTRIDNITYKTVRINKALHYKLKVKALEKEMKITDFIEYLLEQGIR